MVSSIFLLSYGLGLFRRKVHRPQVSPFRQYPVALHSFLRAQERVVVVPFDRLRCSFNFAPLADQGLATSKTCQTFYDSFLSIVRHTSDLILLKELQMRCALASDFCP